MIASKHLAMCEHGTVYLSIPIRLGTQPTMERYLYNCYSRVSECSVDNHHYYCVTTNLRVLVENDLMDDLCYLCEPTEYHVKRVSVKFITDQGILREFTRHRSFSFAAESTRYCNYSRGKFNEEITFIEPCWEMPVLERDIFISHLSDAESHYMALLEAGWKPQQARNVLPLATKCDLVMTGFVDDWNHFFSLRTSIIAETGKPHPQASELADPLYNEFITRGIVSL
jgi:thymidylate synthase (FAD)